MAGSRLFRGLWRLLETVRAGLTIFFDDEMFHREARGGVTRYITEAALALARHQQVPVTIFGGWSQNRTLHELALTGPSNLTVVHEYWSAARRFRALTQAASRLWRRSAFRRLRRDCETVVYHPSLYAYDPIVANAASALVLTVHDMQLEVFQENTTHARRHLPVKRRAIELADWIFCVSRHTADDLHRLVPASQGKTQVVYNDSTIGVGEPDVAAVPHPCGGRPYFLIVGSRRGYKNGRVTIEAFGRLAERHPDLCLLLCGPAPTTEDGLGALPHAVRRDRLVWLQPDDRTLACCYARALGLVYPSSYEGFGLPVLEAMRCGCPVITCSVASIPEVAGPAALYVAPNAESVSAAMLRLIHDPALAGQLRTEGRNQAARFSWPRSSGQMVQGYRTALGRRASMRIRASTVDFASVA